MTDMFEWNHEYSVGIASVDAQHQKLFAIARELYAAMSAGQGKSALAAFWIAWSSTRQCISPTKSG